MNRGEPKPLTVAIWQRNRLIVSVILDYEPDLEIANALESARSSGNEVILNLMLAHEAKNKDS